MNRNLKSFNQFYPINENVAPAKALLLKLAADDKKRRLKLDPMEKIEFTPEEEKKILSNPDYVEVRDYFLNKVKKPGLVYPFTYFRVVEKLPMSNGDDDPNSFSVENLYRKYEQMSPMLSTFPLPFGNIDNYIKRTPQGERAYEKLWDDLENVESQKPIKEFIDNFVGPIRRETKRYSFFLLFFWYYLTQRTPVRTEHLSIFVVVRLQSRPSSSAFFHAEAPVHRTLLTIVSIYPDYLCQYKYSSHIYLTTQTKLFCFLLV
jgi:hypothetical protein